MIPVSKPQLGEQEALFVKEVLSSEQLTYGPLTRAFERALAEFLNVGFVLVTSNGTAAIHLALAALDIGPGDEVLVPDLTYVATANAVRYCGATPVLCDVNPMTWNIDLEQASKRLSSKTKAIIAVHLYGVPCAVSELRMLGKPVIEDAAQGLGGSTKRQALGTLDRGGAFSFYGNKIVTTGEGGAFVTNFPEVAEKARALRGHCMDPSRRYFHTAVGFNYRMSELQAAVGFGQMQRVEAALEIRREIFRRYADRLFPLQEVTPQVKHLREDVVAPWLFTCRVKNRDGLAAALWEQGIETRPTFVPLHRMPMYQADEKRFPNASAIADSGISLPTFVELPPDRVNAICDAVQTWIFSQRKA